MRGEPILRKQHIHMMKFAHAKGARSLRTALSRRPAPSLNDVMQTCADMCRPSGVRRWIQRWRPAKSEDRVSWSGPTARLTHNWDIRAG